MRKNPYFSWIYHYGRFWIRFSYRYLFYRRVEIRGRENFKPDEPLIFAPNHQNALMDDLAMVTTLKQQPFFVARADLFNAKWIVWFFKLAHMMPIWRIRDGYENLAKDQEVFDRCGEIISQGNTLSIFPEGNHNAQRFLRPLKKGMARIAFQTEDRHDFKLGLKVIPTGLDFSHYDNVRGTLTVSYGTPVTITDLKDLYRSDPQAALKELNRRIRVNLLPHMIDIPWLDLHDSVMFLRVMYGARFRELRKLPGKTLFDKFEGDKEMIRMIANLRESDPDGMALMNQRVTEYQALLKKNNYRDHIPANAPYSIGYLLFNTLWLGLGMPIHIYALINNYLLFRIPAWLSRHTFKDPQFRATIAYVSSMAILMPLFYGIQTLIIGLIFRTWWIWLVYLLTLLPSGIFMLHYMFENRKWRSRIRWAWKFRRKDKDVLRMAELRKLIHEQLDNWIRAYQSS